MKGQPFARLYAGAHRWQPSLGTGGPSGGSSSRWTVVPPCNLEISSGLELVWWTRAEDLPGTENPVESGRGRSVLEGSRGPPLLLEVPSPRVRPKGDLALSI